jgi:hypothetical protein
LKISTLGAWPISPLRLPASAKASHGGTGTRRKVLARNADVLVGISNSLCEDSTETPQNPIPQNTVPILALAGFKRIAPEQDTGMDLNEPWITALELFNGGKN